MASARARSADSSSLESRNDAVTQFNGSDKSAGAPYSKAFKHAARSKTPQHAYRIHISLMHNTHTDGQLGV